VSGAGGAGVVISLIRYGLYRTKVFEDIVDLAVDAWNKLVEQPWAIMSIGTRKWAHGF
jgi:hypothetical protein